MKKTISLFKKRSFEVVDTLTKKQKIIGIFGLILTAGTVGSIVFATGDHEGAEPVIETQIEQVLIRKVGDTDSDSISEEGLSSFYGEIVSKDVASINPSREGVISSWNVSVGDAVSAGQILGYITVTGVSSDQQQQLAQQEANALKAQLDLETANKISDQTESVFEKIAGSLKFVADKQRSIYDGTVGSASTTYQTELQAITSRQNLLLNKLQDFGKTALAEIYPQISYASFSNTTYVPSFKFQSRVPGLQNQYLTFFESYVISVNNRKLTDDQIRLFLDKTTEFVSSSISSDFFTEADKKDILADIGALQTDFRDLSDKLTQSTIDKASKERERSQIEVELTKSLSGFDNDLSLKKLDQLSSNERAKNEAKGAKLLAQKLAVSAGGVVPILAIKGGIIATVDKNIGDYVTLSDRIGYISNKNPRKSVRFTIPASWKDINKGDTLSISWRPEYSLGSAVIAGISPIIDDKGGYQAEAVISKETQFPVGASVRIIPENSKKGIFVNRKAIVFKDVTPYVWIVTENQTIRKQEVKVGRGLGEYIEIISGLERDFSYIIILDPQVILENGMKVSDLMKKNISSVPNLTKKVIQDESAPHSHDE